MNAIILSPAQVSNWDLVCALRSECPQVPIVVGQQLQTARWSGDFVIAVHPSIAPIIVRDNGRHEPLKMDADRSYRQKFGPMSERRAWWR